MKIPLWLCRLLGLALEADTVPVPNTVEPEITVERGTTSPKPVEEFVPATSQPDVVLVTLKKALFRTRGDYFLSAKVVKMHGEKVFLRRGRGPVFRRLVAV